MNSEDWSPTSSPNEYADGEEETDPMGCHPKSLESSFSIVLSPATSPNVYANGDEEIVERCCCNHQ